MILVFRGASRLSALTDCLCDAQLAEKRKEQMFLTRTGASNVRQGARANGTEKDPSNLIRIMPAQERDICGAARAVKKAKPFSSSPDPKA
jgi:hypothetical protein